MPEYVRVFGTDWDRMGDEARALTHFIGNRCFMRLEEGHCAALVIEPENGRFVCSIYQSRPDTCHALERGSGQCRGELHEKANRPLLAVQNLLRRPVA